MAGVGQLLQPLLPATAPADGLSVGALGCFPKDILLLLVARFGPRCLNVCRSFHVLAQDPRVMGAWKHADEKLQQFEEERRVAWSSTARPVDLRAVLRTRWLADEQVVKRLGQAVVVGVMQLSASIPAASFGLWCCAMAQVLPLYQDAEFLLHGTLLKNMMSRESSASCSALSFATNSLSPEGLVSFMTYCLSLCRGSDKRVKARALMLLAKAQEHGIESYRADEMADGVQKTCVQALYDLDARLVTAALCVCEVTDWDIPLATKMATVIQRALSGQLQGNQVLCRALRVAALRCGHGMTPALSEAMGHCLTHSAPSVVFEAICAIMKLGLIFLYADVLDTVQRVFVDDCYMKIRSLLVIAKVRPALVREFVPQVVESVETLGDVNWYALELLTLLQA